MSRYYIQYYNLTTPKVSDSKESDGVDYSYDLPGYKNEEVKVTVSSREVEVAASNNSRGEKEFALILPDRLDPASVEAKMENGVLTISAKYKAEARQRKVEVK